MKKTLLFLAFAFAMLSTATLWQSCKKSNSNNSSSSGSAVALSIQTGAQTTSPDKKITYSAVLIDKDGKTSTPGSVTWSVSTTGGGSSLGSFAGSGATADFTPANIGSGTVTASCTVNGNVLTATVPVGVFNTTLFAVAPGAVIWTTGTGTISLTPVYIGLGTTTYTYTSSDATIASVDGSGVITFNKAGNCVITVTANGLTGTPSVQVPVMVLGTTTATLPVARLAITPGSYEMFRGDNTTLTAKAYNTSGSEVSQTFTWSSQDPSVATVDATGKVTAVALGKTTITATASGITGQAEVDVLPDTTIILNPYWASIAPSGTMQFTANTYTVNHSTHALTAITNPTITWTIPSYGISLLDIATVNSTGLVTMNSSATVGLSTVLIASAASPTIEPGAAMITVSDCNCGTAISGVTHIGVTSPTTVNLSLTSNPTAIISALPLDASNSPVSGTLNYCSSNIAACSVSSTGNLTATGIGTSTVTICAGGVQTTIIVNVTL